VPCTAGTIAGVPPELVRDDVTMKVDGDALDIFFPMDTKRYLLSRLAVRLDRQGKQRYQLYIGQSVEPGPLYSWHWDATVMGSIWVIPVEDEPDYRTFFTELAAFCRRTVDIEIEPAKKKLFGKRGG
jgi:hypothetical protein